jgi:SAM-dependent methyltransferase
MGAKRVMIGSILRQLSAGDGIGRALMNLQVRRLVELSGTVLDIGGKGNPSYRKMLDLDRADAYIALDVQIDHTVDVGGSILQLPIADESCDVVICLNVLEHVLGYWTALSEMRRVLKPGGILYGRVPFLMSVHGDPSDYWRYTDATLGVLLARAGFDRVQVETDGGLFSVLYNLLQPVWARTGPVKLFCVLLALAGDYALSKVVGPKNRQRYPLGYFIVAEALGDTV